MNTVKDTLLLADHYPDTENVVFYQDIRAFGKSFEDMFQRSKEAGTRYVRGLPGDIEEDPETDNLRSPWRTPPRASSSSTSSTWSCCRWG